MGFPDIAQPYHVTRVSPGQWGYLPLCVCVCVCVYVYVSYRVYGKSQRPGKFNFLINFQVIVGEIEKGLDSCPKGTYCVTVTVEKDINKHMCTVIRYKVACDEV